MAPRSVQLSRELDDLMLAIGAVSSIDEGETLIAAIRETRMELRLELAVERAELFGLPLPVALAWITEEAVA